MTIVIIAIHIIVCLLLVLIVLLQAGKGADMGAAFGGSSQTIFGPTGPQSLLEKLTAGAAIIFMLTSLSLAYLSAKSPQHSVFTGTPAAPGPPQPTGQPPAQPQPPGQPQGPGQPPAPLGSPPASQPGVPQGRQ